VASGILTADAWAKVVNHTRRRAVARGRHHLVIRRVLEEHLEFASADMVARVKDVRWRLMS
jgi:hypothetical protein